MARRKSKVGNKKEVKPSSEGIVTLTAMTREQLNEDSLAYLQSVEGRAYVCGCADYDYDRNVYFINIKIEEE